MTQIRPLYRLAVYTHMCVCVLVCLFTFEVPFKRVFAPTSQSWMSNIFRDSESLGKEVVSDLKTFTNKGCKIAAQKRFVFGQILPY